MSPMKKDTGYAELDSPGIVCGNCRFMSNIEGEFTEEDGRLVFRADPDPQPRRGPDLFSCGECGAKFTEIKWEWSRRKLGDDVLAAVRETAQAVRAKEWADLETYGAPGE